MKLPVINNTILWVALAVLVVLQLKSCFDKVHKPEKMIRNEERLKYLEEKAIRDSIGFQKRIEWYDSSLAASQNKFDELESKKQATRVIYEKVPVIINGLNNEDLRRAVADFGQ